MYKLHLILKYLRRRRIAWVSLIAVMLCTTMVLVVISVMGGWLDMFESNARGLTGDIVIRAQGLSGFAHYEEIIDAVKQDRDVVAAVPLIETFGLLNINNRKTMAVEVMGLPIEQISAVNQFPQSLHRQHTLYTDKGEKPPPPTFNLHDVTSVELSELPDDVPWVDRNHGKIGAAGDPMWEKAGYDPVNGYLTFRGKMSDEDRDKVAGMSSNKAWKDAVRRLARESNWPGIICGSGVLNIRRGRDGKTEGRFDDLYTLWAKLTVLGVGEREELDASNKAERQYWIADDSHTGMWQYDNNHVYVPFDVLQTDLGMGPGKATALKRVVDMNGGPPGPQELTTAPSTGRYVLQQYAGRSTETSPPIELKKGDPLGFRPVTPGNVDAVAGEQVIHLTASPVVAVWNVEQEVPIPARATNVHIRLKEGANMLAARDRIEAVVKSVQAKHRSPFDRSQEPRVETWKQVNELFIGAIENEKLLVVFLFGIISIVAIFLIFCIFYMIVAEKTKDIGIIKSVGATSMGVAGIFLGYGLVIGIVGAGLGLLSSYLIVHNINGIHTWLGTTFGLVVWNPQVYAFETIPNTMNPREATVILTTAILASVVGALVPAVRAARLHPVEALRWE